MPIEESPLTEKLLESPATERQLIDVAVARTTTSYGYGDLVMKLTRQRKLDDRGRRYMANKRSPAGQPPLVDCP